MNISHDLLVINWIIHRLRYIFVCETKSPVVFWAVKTTLDESSSQMAEIDCFTPVQKEQARADRGNTQKRNNPGATDIPGL